MRTMGFVRPTGNSHILAFNENHRVCKTHL
jgi:hypothetical protein